LEDPGNTFVSVEVGPYDDAAVLILSRMVSVPRIFYLCLRSTDIPQEAINELCPMFNGCGDLRLYMQAVGSSDWAEEILEILLSNAASERSGPLYARVVVEVTRYFDNELEDDEDPPDLAETLLMFAINVASQFYNRCPLDIQHRNPPLDEGSRPDHLRCLRQRLPGVASRDDLPLRANVPGEI
jgi:hypothetical protein